MWLLCNANKPYDLAKFEQAASKLKVELKIIDPTKLVMINGNEKISYYEGTKIDSPKVILNWQGCNNDKLEAQIEAFYTEAKFANTIDEISLVQDKFKWQTVTGLPVVKSIKMHSTSLLSSLKLIEDELSYPFVLKSDTGSLGLGVYLIENSTQFYQVSELINLLDKSFRVHLEQYLDYDHDIRMYVVGDKYWLMKRTSVGDFRANVARNAKVSKYNSDSRFDTLLQSIRQELKSTVLGVDVLVKDELLYVCEINSAPSFKGLETIYEVDIATEILSQLNNL